MLAYFLSRNFQVGSLIFFSKGVFGPKKIDLWDAKAALNFGSTR